MSIQEFAVIPRCSIGPIQLGMSREDVRQILGPPSSVQNAYEKWGIQFPDRDHFFRNAFQVSYDHNLRAEFIEVSAEEGYLVTFEGIHVHASAPDVLVAAIQKLGDVDTTTREYPLNMWFPTLGLNLYREASEQDPFATIGICTEGFGQQSDS